MGWDGEEESAVRGRVRVHIGDALLLHEERVGTLVHAGIFISRGSGKGIKRVEENDGDSERGIK